MGYLTNIEEAKWNRGLNRLQSKLSFEEVPRAMAVPGRYKRQSHHDTVVQSSH